MTIGNIEAAVRTERDFLAAVIDGVDALVVVFDLTGKIVRFNHACEATTGYSLEEALGKSCWDLCLIPAPVEPVTGAFEQFPNQCENYWVTKDGTPRLIAWSNHALVNSSGAVEYIVSTGMDITERTQAEAAMRDNADRLHLALDAADMGIWEWNILTGAVSWSAKLEQIYGNSFDSLEVTYEKFLALVYAQDRARVTDAIRACLEEKQDYDIEFRLVASNGDIRWVRSKGRVFYDETGTPVRMAGVDLDINKRKQDATALQESERFIQRVADAVPGLIYIYDIIENRNIYCNHQVSVLLGYTSAEIQNLGSELFPSLMHPEDLANVPAHYQKFSTTKDGEVIEIEYRMRHKNGEWRWFISRDTVFLRNADGAPKQILGTAGDITERKQTDAALRKSENLYRTLAQNFPNGVVLLFDRNLRYSIAEGQGLAPVGLDKEALEGKTIWEVFPPEICEQMEPIYRSVLAGRPNSWEMPFRDRIGYVQALPVKNEQGENFAGMVVVQDITERKIAEGLQTELIASLCESEERFRCLIDQARDGIFAIDSEGWFVEVNQRACQDLGYTYAEMLTLGVWDLDPSWSEERFAELFKQQMDIGGDDTFEAVIQRKDNSTFPVEMRVGLLEWNQQKYILALLRDITKRKRGEQVQAGLIEFLQESDERFRQMAENIRDIFWMRQVNPPQLLYISPAYEEIWGRSCASLYEEPDSFFDAVHPEDRDRAIAAFARQIQGESTDIEYKIIQINGTIRWIHDRGFPIMNHSGKVYRVTGIAEDITERKLTQMALQQAKEELEVRIAERTAALLITNQQLRQEIMERQQAELALAKSQQELELFFAQSLDGFFFMMLEEPVCWDNNVAQEKVLDYVFAHQQMTKVNDAMLAQYGATKEEFIGLTPNDLFAHDLDYGRQVWQQLFDTGRLHVETDERKLDGTRIWIEGDYICLYDKTGKIIGHFGVQRDISDRKLAQQALQESEERFRQLAENIDSVFWMTDPSINQLIYVSPAYEKIWGSSCDELYGAQKSFLDAIHPEDRDRIIAAMSKETKREYDEEYRIIRPDGSSRWIRDRAFPVLDSTGKVVRIAGIAEDISDRKMAEQALQESQKRYTLAVSAGKVGVWDWNLETNEIYVDPFLKAILGYADCEIPNHLDHWGKLVHPDDGEKVMVVADDYLQGLTSQYSVEHRMLHKDGSIRWFLARGTAIRDASGKAYRMMGTDTDITDLKLAELALLKSEERFRSLVVNVPGAIYRCAWDSDWTMEYISDAIANISNYPAKDFMGNRVRRFVDIIHPQDIPLVESAVQEAVTEKKPFAMEYRIVQPDGSIRWVTDTGQAQYGDNGEVLWIDGAIFDISDRKIAEQELRQSEERLRLVVQNMPVMLDAYDQTNNLIVWNRECERVTGYTAQEIVGNPKAMEMLYPEPAYLQQMMDRWNKIGQTFRDWEWQMTCKDGTVKTIAWFSICEEFPIPGWAGWAVGVDISDRKQAEAEIIKALVKEKDLSELKSRFITMASHEFRTPLSTILSSADLLEYYLEDNSNEKQLEHIQRIQTACLHITQLLNDVLVIGRAEAGKLEFNPSPLNLAEFCRDLIAEIQLTAGYQHKIYFELPDGEIPSITPTSAEETNHSPAQFTIQASPMTQSPPMLYSSCPMPLSPQFLPCLDEKLLRYIFNNLLSNAIKYSPFGGNIYLRLYLQDSHAILQIEDQGIGISKEDQERLFEPFYRGKNVDNISGTGLGLAIVKRAVELHGGKIDFNSEIGRGTKFTIALPLSGNC